ncbi:helix-turn-helix domain-containing protein [Ruminococcus sp. 5_1_39BFAA]|uniref:helix-turn-helix domain-containing protein n=1 Tax=Ruminococcus sp. 5_1_39BFAA TaxID=457412 RepID=UPI00356591E5
MCNMIGHRIKERRKELKLTQVQIKELCGISNGNLSDFENGNKTPSANSLVALSKALQVSTDWILTGENHRGDISDVILSEYENNLLELFRELDSNDQEEILDIIKIKINRKKRLTKLSNSGDTATSEIA